MYLHLLHLCHLAGAVGSIDDGWAARGVNTENVSHGAMSRVERLTALTSHVIGGGWSAVVRRADG